MVILVVMSEMLKAIIKVMQIYERQQSNISNDSQFFSPCVSPLGRKRCSKVAHVHPEHQHFLFISVRKMKNCKQDLIVFSSFRWGKWKIANKILLFVQTRLWIIHNLSWIMIIFQSMQFNVPCPVSNALEQIDLFIPDISMMRECFSIRMEILKKQIIVVVQPDGTTKYWEVQVRLWWK